MDKIDALNVIYSVISIAKEATSILQEECRGNSNRHDWCKGNEHTLREATQAYDVLSK